MLEILGSVGLGLAVLQLAIFLWSSVRRSAIESQIQQSQIEKVRDEIAFLRRAHVTVPIPEATWSGFRKFRVLRKRTECDGCQSIYLAPHDGRPLPSYRPGQYLTLRLTVPGEKSPLVRCYSLSEAPREQEYRITVKKLISQKGPPSVGKASSFLCDILKANDIVDVKAPLGNFFLDVTSTRPVVCIGAGIGITPLLAMLETLFGTDPGREAFLFLGMRNSREHPFKGACEKLAEGHPQMRLVVCYSQPHSQDRQGEDYHRLGRLDPRIVTAILPSRNYDFFLCGPGEFMRDMIEGLTEWGVSKAAIHAESFGPSSFPKIAAEMPLLATSDALNSAPTSAASQVRFDRTGRDLPWDSSHTCLLEFAEKNGISIPSGCRTGSCGSCATAIKSGKVRYSYPADFECAAGECVPCVCVPEGDLVLDA